MDVEECDEIPDVKRSRILRKQSSEKKICARDERNASIKKVSQILLKGEHERTIDELLMLRQCSDAVEEVQSRWRKRDEAKRRIEEIEEPLEQIEKKCGILARAIMESEHLVVYTGAGISTAAKIPDYRGTNGIWTRLQQGKDIGNHDLSQAEPTFTHMALAELYRRNILKYIVSQNCDGLHLRSGLPRTALSELHGNMYIEVCKNCKPAKEYWRTFDVTENTARFSHKTMRKCYECNGPLVDTIVHFGERGILQWPLNWSGACVNAKKATTILCLGSSLKVLKKYPWLWQMDKPAKKRPNLYIVNLQWTPKDDCASIKIHGKCDEVVRIVMNCLGISVPCYNRENDPLFTHATELCNEELHTTTQPILKHISTKHEILNGEDCSKKDFDRCGGIQVINKPTDLISKYNNKDKKFDIGCDNNDKSSNINVASNFISNQDSLPQSINKNTAFSIDNILYSDRAVSSSNTISTNIIINHDVTVLKYYQLSNILLQNQMLSYHDLMYYPFQTSFLYSGLHNIIQPSPFCDQNYFNITAQNFVKKSEDTVLPACRFCNDHYKSILCLFYAKFDSNFVNPKIHMSKLDIRKTVICVCCDYSTDDECYDDENKVVDDHNLPDKIKKVENLKTIIEKEQLKKIQAGWFGKGYKKNRKPKKR